MVQITVASGLKDVSILYFCIRVIIRRVFYTKEKIKFNGDTGFNLSRLHWTVKQKCFNPMWGQHDKL